MRQMIRVLIPVCLLVFTAVLPAQAQERVQARGWAKSSYGRIIFDWPRPVQHEARVSGRKLTVSFARPMRADLRAVVSGLGAYLTGARMSPDGKTATFDLAGNYTMESFVSGSSVVIDLRRSGAAAAPQPRAVMASTPAAGGSGSVRVEVGQHPGFTRIVFDWGGQVDYSVARDLRAVSMRFARSGSIDLRSLDVALPKPAFGTPSTRAASGGLIVDLVVPERSFIRHFRDGGKVVLDVQDEGGDFGGLVAGDAVGGRMMETISPTGEIVSVPAMVGTHVAVSPGGIPLVTEDVTSQEAQAVPYQGSYSPLTHYDPNATGLPRNLLLYDRPSLRKNINGG